MDKQFFFLSGLPRTGSTVLASILSQNPGIYVSASSPLVGLMHGAKYMWDTAEHTKAHKRPGQIERVLGAIAQSFYADIEKPVVFDKNRAWANPENQEVLRMAFGKEPKIVCTVRPVADILASFISLIRKNPTVISFIDADLNKLHEECTDENRCGLLMSEKGHVYQSWAVLNAGHSVHPENMLFVEYDELTSRPKEALAKVYAFLELPPFEHDFSHIENPVPENDAAAYNLPGMHEIRGTLEKKSPNAREVLGEKLFAMYQGGEFWKGKH